MIAVDIQLALVEILCLENASNGPGKQVKKIEFSNLLFVCETICE